MLIRINYGTGEDIKIPTGLTGEEKKEFRLLKKMRNLLADRIAKGWEGDNKVKLAHCYARIHKLEQSANQRKKKGRK